MRLLLAEDERELSAALETVLRHQNYLVDVVENGTDALAYLELGCYDGAILDVMMPGLDGISVVRQLRARGNAVPVLLLTARTGIEDRVEGLDSGADDYLGKPFAMKELLARIRAMTRRRERITPDNDLHLGNVTLCPASGELRTPAGTLHLANKEYQMLELLLLNPGQVVAPEQFMEKIWGYDTETENSVVWVYISNLRKHLASLGADVEIRVARSRGYFAQRKE